jgi:plasmid maintenance system antidote protein VapI
MNKEINIGSLIRKTVKERQISVKCFAEKLGKDRSTVYDIFNRTSIDTDTLVRISEILEYNFFLSFCDDEDKIEAKMQEIFPHYPRCGKISYTNIFCCRNRIVFLR